MPSLRRAIATDVVTSWARLHAEAAVPFTPTLERALEQLLVLGGDDEHLWTLLSDLVASLKPDSEGGKRTVRGLTRLLGAALPRVLVSTGELSPRLSALLDGLPNDALDDILKRGSDKMSHVELPPDVLHLLLSRLQRGEADRQPALQPLTLGLIAVNTGPGAMALPLIQRLERGELEAGDPARAAALLQRFAPTLGLRFYTWNAFGLLPAIMGDAGGGGGAAAPLPLEEVAGLPTPFQEMPLSGVLDEARRVSHALEGGDVSEEIARRAAEMILFLGLFLYPFDFIDTIDKDDLRSFVSKIDTQTWAKAFSPLAGMSKEMMDIIMDVLVDNAESLLQNGINTDEAAWLRAFAGHPRFDDMLDLIADACLTGETPALRYEAADAFAEFAGVAATVGPEAYGRLWQAVNETMGRASDMDLVTALMKPLEILMGAYADVFPDDEPPDVRPEDEEGLRATLENMGSPLASDPTFIRESFLALHAVDPRGAPSFEALAQKLVEHPPYREMLLDAVRRLPTAEGRRHALLQLGATGLDRFDGRAIDVALAVLAEDAEEAREGAVGALMIMAKRPGADRRIVLGLLDALPRLRSGELRGTVLGALGELAREGAVVLDAEADGPGVSVRELALRAALERAKRDRDGGVRTAAMLAAAALTGRSLCVFERRAGWLARLLRRPAWDVRPVEALADVRRGAPL